MKSLSNLAGLPSAIVVEETPEFVPRMVMTPELSRVTTAILDQWAIRDRFAAVRKFGVRPLDRVLFFGPPGNGKTMCATYMSRKLRVPLTRVLCNQVRGSCLGDTTSNVANIVQWLNNQTQPNICLFDEIESIFIDRREAAQACDREVAAATTIFLQTLDRWKAPTLIVMATNIPDQIDFALLSRIELKLEFGPPTQEQAREVVAYYGELLHEHGSEIWAPRILESIETRLPLSFRELFQMICFACRDWIAGGVN